MKKISARFLIVIVLLIGISLACGIAPPGNRTASDLRETEVSLKMTEVALAENKLTAESNTLAMTAIAIEQAATQEAQRATEILPPTDTPMAVQESTQEQPPTQHALPQSTETPNPTITPQPTSDRLILSVNTNRDVFHCISLDGPSTLTISVSLSDIDKGMAVYWRLKDKATNRTSEWESKDMRRAGGNTRDFTFDGDVIAGTNNFYYPPGFGESWFQYQIIADFNIERTDVFSDVTFFPCAN